MTSLDTAFLLAINRGDTDLRAHILAEITRRAASCNDAIVGFAPSPDEENDGSARRLGMLYDACL